MKRRWVWPIAVAVLLFGVGIVGIRLDGGRGDSVRLQGVTAPRDAGGDDSSTSTSGLDPLGAGISSTTTTTSTSPPATATSVPRPRIAAAPTNTTWPSTAEPTPTTRARRWVTVATLSHDFDDGGGWHDSERFDLSTGKARFVLDTFEVGNENGQLNWNIMGSDPYHSLAHGQCEGPVTSTPPSGYPPTTANPSPTGPPCNAVYEVSFEVQPGNYYLRVGSTHSKWTARIQELR